MDTESKPVTTGKIAGGVAMGILIALGVLVVGGGLLYFLLHYVFWN